MVSSLFHCAVSDPTNAHSAANRLEYALLALVTAKSLHQAPLQAQRHVT